MPTSEAESRRRNAVYLAAALVALVLFSSLALVNFAATNAGELLSYARLWHYFFLTLAGAGALVVALKLLFRRMPLWRVILVCACIVYVFYAYDEVSYIISGLIGKDRYLRQLLVWSAIVTGTAWATIRISGHPPMLWITLALGAIFVSLPLAKLVAQSHAAPVMASERQALKPIVPLFRENVYWIVLDAYPRHDVLREMFGFDNSDFLAELTKRGFIVAENSSANFPATIYSISSTLSMAYPVDETGKKLADLGSLRRIVQGENRTVELFRSMGYRYVHFANGYDALTLCGGSEDLCVVGTRGLDELDVAILANTPIIDVLKLRSRPEKPKASLFDIKAVDGLRDKMWVVREAPEPFFLYAHIVAPHVPSRYTADCRFRAASPDLQTWNPEEKGAFLEQLECVNKQTISLLDGILAHDRNAVVILQSDHGTAFRGQFAFGNAPAPEKWSDDDLRERFAVLNAIRLPSACRSSVRADATLIDTFPVVLNCLGGMNLPEPKVRFFVSPYDNSPLSGTAVEYAASPSGPVASKPR